jgi:hypothetical protein
MKKALSMAMGLVLAGAGAAWAEPATYSLTGMGAGVLGTSKCATYQIIVDVTVDGKDVKGTFKQQGRPERSFTSTLDDKGTFKARAEVGDGNIMDVIGTISDAEKRIFFDGYCKFEGRLTQIK